jgi:hypothetical protein
MQSFEGLGTFYLGAAYDLDQRKRSGEPLLYDSKDLVTHAVCVGMTGSGKTGLCTVLLEEAAIDGIPALVIDPKGDLANLLLRSRSSGRGLRALGRSGGGEAERRLARAVRRSPGRAVEERSRRVGPGRSAHRAHARGVRVRGLHAGLERGAAALDPEELRRARPGDAGGRRRAARERADDRVEPARARRSGRRSGQERESILLATVLEQAWRAGRDLDLGALIQRSSIPPCSASASSTSSRSSRPTRASSSR